MAELILTEVRKSFRDAQGREVRAVAGVSLTVETGELLVLVGPSGCGKSTLLRLVAGLEMADGGTVTLAGRVLNDVPPADRDVAMVFQNYALFPHLTVAGNIAFGLKFRGASKTQIHEAVREAAALLRLEDLLDRKPHALSGGQRQRVALGRAMVRRPKVFLLDEPLSNLDARLRAEMRAEIARLHERLRATMLFVTHDQTEAMTLGQRVCVLHEGRVMQAGRPLEVYRRPANTFVAEFVGSPGMNLLRGALTAGAGRTVFRADTGNSQPLDIVLEGEPSARAASGRPVLLGVRPEDFELSAAADSFTVCVEIIEPLGHETILHATAGGQRLVIRTREPGPFTPQQELRLRCRVGRASLFDPETRCALA